MNGNIFIDLFFIKIPDFKMKNLTSSIAFLKQFLSADRIRTIKRIIMRRSITLKYYYPQPYSAYQLELLA